MDPSTADTERFSKLALSTADIPTSTENAPIVGERSIHTLDDLKAALNALVVPAELKI